MYKLEVYKDGKLIKRLSFITGEGLELLDYKRKYESEGCGVQVWKLISGC